MKCASCGNAFNDGVQCTSCRKHLDYSCAGLTEVGWRKLGADRRAAWRCSSCKLLSPLPSPTADPVSMEVVLREIRDLKKQLIGLPSLIEDIKCIKDELSELTHASEFVNGKLDDFAAQIVDVQNRVTNVENLQSRVNSLESDIQSLSSQFSAMDQRSRLNNIEIKGVPLKKDENLFSIVESICKATGAEFSKSRINFLHRSPLHGTKEKSIIVGFTNRYTKDDFVAAARTCKTLSASSLGYLNSNQRVYINDHLNGDSKVLLNKAKLKAKDAKFSYVWVRHGKIHARRNDTSPVIIIAKDQDLNKIA